MPSLFALCLLVILHEHNSFDCKEMRATKNIGLTNIQWSWPLLWQRSCKILHKYCNLGCCTNFSHIAVSLYAKWLNTWLKKLWLTVAHCRSNCKLSVIKDCTATQLTIFGVISVMSPHSSPPCTTSPVNEGQNLDDDAISVLAALIFRPWGDSFSLFSLFIPAPYSL